MLTQQVASARPSVSAWATRRSAPAAGGCGGFLAVDKPERLATRALRKVQTPLPAQGQQQAPTVVEGDAGLGMFVQISFVGATEQFPGIQRRRSGIRGRVEQAAQREQPAEHGGLAADFGIAQKPTALARRFTAMA